METRYRLFDHQTALHWVMKLRAEAKRVTWNYNYTLSIYQRALGICYQFGFEGTASELFCELSMIATQHGLFMDALQYARRCDSTYAKVI